MELSRDNAQEFNDFIKAALGEWSKIELLTIDYYAVIIDKFS